MNGKGSLILFNIFANRGLLLDYLSMTVMFSFILCTTNSPIVHMLKVTPVLNIKQNTEILNVLSKSCL